MGRLWRVGLGLAVIGAAGYLLARRLGRLGQALTPEGLAERATSAIEAVRGFGHDVASAASRREAELRQALLAEGPRSDDAEALAAQARQARQARRARRDQAAESADDVFDF